MGIRRARNLWVVAVLATQECVTPNTNNLQQSFTAQVQAVSGVRDFKKDDYVLEFSAPVVSGSDAKWLVRIDSVTVEPNNDEQYPYRGIIHSSWYANGELVEPRGVMSFLPMEFLDQGIAQECWALWENDSAQWDW